MVLDAKCLHFSWNSWVKPAIEPFFIRYFRQFTLSMKRSRNQSELRLVNKPHVLTCKSFTWFIVFLNSHCKLRAFTTAQLGEKCVADRNLNWILLVGLKHTKIRSYGHRKLNSGFVDIHRVYYTYRYLRTYECKKKKND